MAGDGKGQSRVLVVDDELTIRFMLERRFQKAGWAVDTASSALEATELFAADPDGYDVVVTDVVMPGADGVALFEAVREMRPEQPVVFISGYSDERLSRAGDLGGRWGFQSKPFQWNRLLELVDEVRSDDPVERVYA